MEQKIFLSALSKGRDWKKEVQGLSDRIKTGLGGKSCDLAVFFVSETYKDFDPRNFSKLVHETFACRVSIGCNSSGVISNDKEIEMQPAISILAMHLPGVEFRPFYISGDDSHSIANGAGLINFLDIYPNEKAKFIAFADPMSFEISKFLAIFNEAYKGTPVIGGLASGGVMGSPNWLSLNGAVYLDGAVGLALIGNIEFDVIVSQGCRPVGRPLVITKAENNVLYELAGQPALTVLQDILLKLPAKDKKLAERSLFAGLVMNENQTQFKRGDFLIRNIVGFDPETGSLSIGEFLNVGHTIQFQLRDAETSSEDLKILLEKLQGTPHSSPQGGLLVACCGRGQNLYGVPDYDSRMIQSMIGPLPLTGFFANGEIGPIGAKNYVHGYTSSLVIFK